MKRLIGLVFLLLTQQAFSQSKVQVKKDSVKILNAELVIENESRNVKGVLHNAGNGRTEFKVLQLENLGDTAIAIKGQDTIAFKGGSGSSVVQNPVPFTLSIRAISSTQQQLKWWKSPQDLYTLPKVGVIGGSQGKGAFTSTYNNSIIGRLTTYLNSVATSPVVINYCQNGYNTRRLMPNGANSYVDASNNITKALADGNKIIILVTPSNDADPNNPAGGATSLSETMANIAVIEDACVKAGATLFVFSGFPRHDFIVAARIQQLELSQLLLKQFGSRCAYVYKLLEDPANPYKINPLLETGDGAHLNDQGALIAYIPMRDVLVGYYTSNTQISRYELQRAGSLNAGFADYQTISTPDVTTLNLNVDNAFYRIRYRQHDGKYSDWSNVVQGLGTVSGSYPIVNAGPAQTITLPATLTLSATASDPVGTITTYLWAKLQGGTATIQSPGTAQTTVTGLSQGVYTFRCTVTNNSGLQSYDDVFITVNGSPTTTKTARFNFSLTSKPVTSYTNLFGHPHSGVLTGTDPVTGIGLNTVASNAWSPNGSVSALDNLTVVNDGGGYVVDQAALANAFFTGNHSAVVNFKVTGLTPGKLCKILVIGNAVSTPRVTKVVVNGETKQYAATQNSSKAAIFDQVPIPSDGIINIAAYAHESDGSSYGVISAIIVDEYIGETGPVNQLPVVNAGYDQSIELPSIVTLTATASDPDGTIDSYLWTKISGGNATINSPNAATTVISGLSSGTYVFRCTVTDSDGGTAFDDVQVIATSPSITRTGSFNFSLLSNPVSGFVNLTGHPHLAVRSGTSASGIGINTIATSAYAPNDPESALSGLTVTDDGQGYVVNKDVFKGVMFTVAYSPTDNLEITGLTPGKYCKILFTANAFSSPRNTMVRVNGQVKQFSATQNKRNAAIFDFVLVPADGKVRIAFYAENTTSYAGLVSAVVVSEY